MIYTQLPILAQYGILVNAMLLLVMQLFNFLLIIRERKWHLNHSLSLVITLTDIVLVFCLRCLIVTAHYHVEIPFVKDWPWYVFGVLELAQIIYLAHRRYINHRYRMTVLGRDSIREAIENIPLGLSFSDLSGRMILTNHMLYQELEELLGYTPNNMEHVWNELSQGEASSFTCRGCSGRMYQLTRETIIVHNHPYIQTTITDITMLHELYKQVERNNALVEAQRREMKNFADRMIRSNHEEEVLRRKIQIHNELGQNILATRQLLLSRGTLEEYHENARNWHRIAAGFSKIAGQQTSNAGELLKEILAVAMQIGCEVELSEDIMPQLVQSSVIRQSIREAIVNAVRHGQATRLTIQPITEDETVGISISNNGTVPESVPEYTGGLKNLSEALLAVSGELSVTTDPEWRMEIRIPAKYVSNLS